MNSKIIEVIAELIFFVCAVLAAVGSIAVGNTGLGILWILFAVVTSTLLVTMARTVRIVPTSRLSKDKYKWNVTVYTLLTMAMGAFTVYAIVTASWAAAVWTGLMCSGDLLYCISNLLEMKQS